MLTRSFIPGSEWAYFKIYTGTKSADHILISMLPLLESMKNEGVIDRFFFIRYNDPNFHLRLRLHLCQNKNFTKLLSILFDYLENNFVKGLVWDVQWGTYNREVERYGKGYINIVESIFCIDSDVIIRILSLLNKNGDEAQRWLVALLLIDDLLSIANYDITSKSLLLKELSNSFTQEFGYTNYTYKKRLDSRYRDNKDVIFNVLNNRQENPIQAYTNYFQLRSTLLSPFVKRIVENYDNEISLDSLFKSIVHMTMNRLFLSDNRLHEMVIYDFLSRYYTSTIARNYRVEKLKM